MAPIEIEFWRLHAVLCELDGFDLNPGHHRKLHDILVFSTSHPEHREELAGCFIEIVKHLDEKYPLSWIVVVYCMRELRWPEVKLAVEEKLKGKEIISPRCWRYMLEPWKEDWNFKGFFKYYDEGIEP